jgi:uncharacterized membrane protein
MRIGSASGISFGIALAGFWDGISLHSILQWHHMISSWVPATDMHGMHVNMIADGMFDLFCWIVTILGIVLFFREAKQRRIPSARAYAGSILVGAGLFNFVEGVIDHETLGIHHVHGGPHWLAWDLGFLALGGVLLIAIGWILQRRPERAELENLRAA